MKGRKNPYAKSLKKQITIRMGVDIIDYFKQMSEETGVPFLIPQTFFTKISSGCLKVSLDGAWKDVAFGGDSWQQNVALNRLG